MGYVGLDYGLGRSNVDNVTGIRYGVISQNSVLQAWADSSSPVYGEMECSACGATLSIEDSNCPKCNADMQNDLDYVEPIGWEYLGDGYELTDCLDNDIFVLKAPYYTFAQFCSPCVPGAGNLDNAMPDGVKTFCLGHDWFESGKAPYPVYSVENDVEVTPC